LDVAVIELVAVTHGRHVRMNTLVDQREGKICKAVFPEHSHPKIVPLDERLGPIHDIERSPCRSAHHEGGLKNCRLKEKFYFDSFARRLAGDQYRAIGTQIANKGAQDVDVAILVEKCHLTL